MINPEGFLVASAIAGLALVPVLSLRHGAVSRHAVMTASRTASIMLFVSAVAVALLTTWQGSAITVPVSMFALRFDPFSLLMLLLVAFTGLIVLQYSRQYLDGDARQSEFMGGLCLTLAAASLLVVAGNLLQLVIGWIGTGAALKRLLLFYPERKGARLAARKYALIAGMADVCLILAAWLLYRGFGTGDIGEILAAARTAGSAAVPSAISIAAILLAIAALLKSAQFPFHGWLTEVMETPTPVSALLHAGIINAGGFLMIRFADVMLLSSFPQHLLVAAGALTAVFGSVVMLTQTSVKVALAWSTIAQMGFMLMQCGFGAYPMAALHILAHSLYKAHAFLSSGSVVDIARTSWLPDLKTSIKPAAVLSGLVAALAVYGVLGWLTGYFADESPVKALLGAILVMGLGSLFVQSSTLSSRWPVSGQALKNAAIATLSYFVLQSLAIQLLTPLLPPIPQPDVTTLVLMGVIVASFATLMLLQLFAPRWLQTRSWKVTRVHLANGFYVNAIFNRLMSRPNRPAV